MKHFKFYSKQNILAETRIRKFETRIGEIIQHLDIGTNWIENLERSSAKYILFGIPEDLGIKANQTYSEEYLAWFPFLDSFLNIQSNDFLTGENILLLGHFDFTDLKLLIEANAMSNEEKTEAYRHAVMQIDEEVEKLIKVITELRKIPIMIGGGQNNAYPAIKGAAKGLLKAAVIPLAQINCINLGSYTHYQAMEGRHSGNAFRYADEDGYLNRYCIVGLDENHLQQNVWKEITENPFVDFITYEDIFLHDKKNFIQAVAYATEFTEDSYTGIDIDIACIEDALNGSNITGLHARQFITFVATDVNVAYLQICESANEHSEQKPHFNKGKIISHLVADFVKAHSALIPLD